MHYLKYFCFIFDILCYCYSKISQKYPKNIPKIFQKYSILIFHLIDFIFNQLIIPYNIKKRNFSYLKGTELIPLGI